MTLCPGSISVRHRPPVWPSVLCLCGLLLVLGAAPCCADWITLGAPYIDHPDYDYSVSVIQEGNLRHVWWCGYGSTAHPANTGQRTDVIFHATHDLGTGQWTPAVEVLEASNAPLQVAARVRDAVSGGDESWEALRVAEGYLAPTGDAAAGGAAIVDGAFIGNATTFLSGFPYLNHPRPGSP